eukprot:1668-Pleurochrysis_carterae.AAC.1
MCLRHTPSRRLPFGLDRVQEARVAQPIRIHVRLPGHGDCQPLAGQRSGAAQQFPQGRCPARGRV